METLSDKRKELFDNYNKVTEGSRPTHPIPDSLIKLIEEQDKEFIRKLKEEIKEVSEGIESQKIGILKPVTTDMSSYAAGTLLAVLYMIDKLAGDKLI